jgi:hypothetical protein
MPVVTMWRPAFLLESKECQDQPSDMMVYENTSGAL